METQLSQRDGQYDFDFWVGTWKIHNRRLKHPLSGSNEWYEFEGTISRVRFGSGKPISMKRCSKVLWGGFTV